MHCSNFLQAPSLISTELLSLLSTLIKTGLTTQYFFSCFHFWQVKVALILLIDTLFLITDTVMTFKKGNDGTLI